MDVLRAGAICKCCGVDVDGVVGIAGYGVGTPTRWCLNGCTLWYLVRNLYNIAWLPFWFFYLLPFIGTRWTSRWLATIKLYKTTKFNIKYQANNYFTVSNENC